MKFEGFPVIIGIELTLACNLRCRHCASSAGNPREGELDLHEMLDLCDQFPSLLVQEVDFTGGEPLLRSDWPRIAERLKKHKIPFRMVTNGLLLEENVPVLSDLGIATVGVSLDGLEDTHDRIREKPGLFRKIISGIEAALDAGVPVAAITAVNHLNVNELALLQSFLHELGIKHWQVQPTFALGRAKEGSLDLSESTFLKIGRFVHANITTCSGECIGMVPADGVGYYTELDTRDPSWKGCGAGRASCGITSNGDVKGCLSLPDHLVEGNLREQDLWSIWFSDDSFAYNRQFTPDDLGEFCEGCEFGEQCMGGCLVMSHSSTGEFHNDPYCFHRILNRA